MILRCHAVEGCTFTTESMEDLRQHIREHVIGQVQAPEETKQKLREHFRHQEGT